MFYLGVSFFTVILMFTILYFKNTILSLFQFIFLICLIAGIFFFFGFEFLSLCLIIIYVGVIAILFLFSLIMYTYNNRSFDNLQFNFYFSLFFLSLFKFLYHSSLYLTYFQVFSLNFFKNNLLLFTIQLTEMSSYISLFNVYSSYIYLLGTTLFVVFIGLQLTKD